MIRIGIVGCAEHTHGKMWAKMLTSSESRDYGMQVTKLYDQDISVSMELADELGLAAVDSLEEMANAVDGVLITEAYPINYLKLARPFLERGMPVFLNRPFAASIAQAKQIIELAWAHDARIFSASALDYTRAAQKLKDALKSVDDVRYFSLITPTANYYWYLPHAIAVLNSVFGLSIEYVQASGIAISEMNEHEISKPLSMSVAYRKEAKYPALFGHITQLGGDIAWYGFKLKIITSNAELEEKTIDVGYEQLFHQMSVFFNTKKEPIPREEILHKTIVFHKMIESIQEGGIRKDIKE